MSTRCAIIVRQRSRYSYGDEETDELFRLYRHSDGYPACTGMSLADALDALDAVDRDDYHGWAIAFMHALYVSDRGCYEVDTRGGSHGDIEYLYVVEGYVDYVGGKSMTENRIMCWKVRGFGERYEDTMARDPFFSGTPEDFRDMYGTWLDAEKVR